MEGRATPTRSLAERNQRGAPVRAAALNAAASHSTTTQVPPAPSIASRAAAENLCAWTVSPLLRRRPSASASARSHSQIGRVLNVSRGASKALVHRAGGSLHARRAG